VAHEFDEGIYDILKKKKTNKKIIFLFFEKFNSKTKLIDSIN
jgi:hypothetical protein